MAIWLLKTEPSTYSFANLQKDKTTAWTGVANATGAAIYFPRGPVNKAYSKLDFAKATAWRPFLDAYHNA